LILIIQVRLRNIITNYFYLLEKEKGNSSLTRPANARTRPTSRPTMENLPALAILLKSPQTQSLLRELYLRYSASLLLCMKDPRIFLLCIGEVPDAPAHADVVLFGTMRSCRPPRARAGLDRRSMLTYVTTRGLEQRLDDWSRSRAASSAAVATCGGGEKISVSRGSNRAIELDGKHQ
jgi:hypothetical protein